MGQEESLRAAYDALCSAEAHLNEAKAEIGLVLRVSATRERVGKMLADDRQYGGDDDGS